MYRDGSIVELVVPDGERSDTDGSSSSATATFHTERRSEWWQSAAVITGEIMGTGVLSLPYACSRLGWALGLSSALGFGATAVYSGLLLSTCRNHLYPDATSFADLAGATGGRRFATFTRVAIAVGWACILPYYLVAAASALEAAFPGTGLCYWQWSLILMLIMAPILQIRSLHGLSLLSLMSTFAILVVLCVLIPALVASRAATVVTSVGLPPNHGDFLKVYGSFGSFIFAYQGQSMFLEILREMKRPSEFPYALLVANGIMVAAYIGICIVGYGFHGEGVAGFLPDTLPEGAPRSVVGLLLCYHTMVSYLLTGQPLYRCVHLALFPATADATGCKAALQWAGITLSFLIFAFVVANAVPFFADFQVPNGRGLRGRGLRG